MAAACAAGIASSGAAGELSGAASSHWSLQLVRLAPPPPVKGSSWAATPVDRFILARLEAHGLEPAPAASRVELVRRAYFDLLGLPPSPEAVEAFCKDTTPNAFERLVDRLLEQPQFGERMGQGWLDVVRFAESEGFEYDRHLPDAWRYRDYVVGAFNRDKPFDRFVIEQIAGDEIGPEDAECQTAAVFHRLGPVRRNAGNPEIALSRNEVLTERTDILGAAFMGLTVGCARCHDHKLDPISQVDYYRLQAYLAATQERDVILLGAAERASWQDASAGIQSRLKQLRRAAEDAEGDERKRLRAEIEVVEASLPPQPPTIPSVHNDASQRTAIHVLRRGDWERKGPAVGPRPPSALVDAGLAELAADTAAPRTELARWLARAEHPLTARVIVNRVWQQHFGAGLVRTPNDFGSHGDAPSHPDLLDWLATELVRGGWRLKPLHRLLMLSSAYRQSSRSPHAAAATRLDPDNRLLWRFNRRRLSAEEIRDAMLSVSGTLEARIGGPSTMLAVDDELVRLLYKPSQWQVATNPADHFRRSIYLIAKRNLRLPFMETFDQPTGLTSCGRRESSTHAPQALELMNGAMANELAGCFARRLERDAGGDAAARVRRGFALALGREPAADEAGAAMRFVGGQPLREFALALFNLNGFLYVE
jgi:hypothetical protein